VADIGVPPRDDPDPPAVLFALGDLAALDATRVAIVGTRRCTGTGAGFARELGRELSEAGVAVVSGLALGIDGASHRGVLDAGGRPVGVVGSGLDVVYPSRHRDLWTRVSGEGVLLSEAPLGARYVDKATLLRESDHLVLVLPYSASSHHAIGAAELALMKPTATLTNVARGGIVDDAALAEALRERRIAAAGLDVFENEPAVHPALLDLPNVVLLPHIGSATEATRRAMVGCAADNLVAALTGGVPPTPINPEVLPLRP